MTTGVSRRPILKTWSSRRWIAPMSSSARPCEIPFIREAWGAHRGACVVPGGGWLRRRASFLSAVP